MKVSAKGGQNLEKPPEGAHISRCYRIVDLGTVLGEFKGKPKESRKLLITWELCSEMMSDGRPFSISKRYTASLSEKAILRGDLKSWRGRDFTAEELECFDLKAVLGKPCMLNIVHEKRDGGEVYANVTAIMPLPGGVTAPPLVNPIVHVSLDEEFDRAAFDTLSDGLKEAISKSPEYKELMARAGSGDAGGAADDDDVPF